MIRHIRNALLFLALGLSAACAANNPADVPHVANIAAMQALGTASAQYPAVMVDDYSTPGSGGGGYFNWTIPANAPGGACTADTGTVFLATGVASSVGCRVRNYAGALHSSWFGISPLVADNTTELQAFINVLKPGRHGIVDCGDYHFASALDTSSFFGTLDGQNQAGDAWQTGKRCAKLIQDTDNTPFLHFDALSYGYTIENLVFACNNQQTGADTASTVLYFDAPGAGVYYAYGQILNNSFDKCYNSIAENNAIKLSFFNSVISRNSHGDNMTGAFMDMRQAVTTGASGNKITENDIRGSNTATAVALINLQGWNDTLFSGNVFGQNSQLPVMTLLSSELSGDAWKIAEGGTFLNTGSVIDCNTGKLNIQTLVIDNGASAASGKIYGFSGNCTITITGGAEFSVIPTAAVTSYLFNSGSMSVDYITGLDPSSAWTDVGSTPSVNFLRVTSLENPALSADAGDAAYAWTPGTSPNVVLYNTTLSADRNIQVANTNNISGNTCLTVVRTAAANGGHNLLLKDPGGTTIVTLASAPSTGKMCYTRLGGGTNQTTWFQVQP